MENEVSIEDKYMLNGNFDTFLMLNGNFDTFLMFHFWLCENSCSTLFFKGCSIREAGINKAVNVILLFSSFLIFQWME
jgi:hypothetical protein